MVARREIRRRNFDAAHFVPSLSDDGSAHCCPHFDGQVVVNDIRFEILVPGDAQEDLPVAHRLVKLSDGDDEPMVSPWHVVLRDEQAERVLDEVQLELELAPLFVRVETNGEFDTRYQREDLDDLFTDDVVETDASVFRAPIYRRAGDLDGLDIVEATTDLLRLISMINDRLPIEHSSIATEACPCCGCEVEIATSITPSAAAPVYGLLSSQRTHPSEDVESTTPVNAPVSTAGPTRPARVTIIDTGLALSRAWNLPIGVKQPDSLLSAIAPKNTYLGYAAGHGTFIAGVVHQRAPGAVIDVMSAATPDGLVSELRLVAQIDGLGKPGTPAPDVLILSMGGFAVKPGTLGLKDAVTGAPVVPTALRSALVALVQRLPGLVIVASAGNDGTVDPCYPAAFTLDSDRAFATHIVAVSAVDLSGHRASFANYGPWVSASALGTSLRSIYAEGTEHPLNEPDMAPETFRGPSYARWSGTSFSAPIVAGAIAQEIMVSASKLTGVAAWAAVKSRAPKARDFGMGVAVDVGAVAHD